MTKKNDQEKVTKKSDQEKIILEFCKEPKSKKEIMQYIGVNVNIKM